MRISLNWLKDYIKIPPEYSPKQIADLITLHTAEVETIENQGKDLSGVVVGEILEIGKHPNADKLNTAKVNIGKEQPLNLIFGQMVTMKVGNRIPVAVAPTTLPTGMVIEKKELRGVLSEGMLCLDQELGFKKEGISIQLFKIKSKPGTPITEALGLNDTIIEIDNKSLTHRPDLWGHYGIAREVAALTNKKLKKLDPKVQATFVNQSDEHLSVEVKNPELCPRYIGVKISNIQVKESPKWIQKKLEAAGHTTYNNIVDITNFISSELGQPMHAFDANLVKGGIVVRTATTGEKIKTLDGKDRELTDKMLLIADHEKPLAIAGIMGGEFSGVTEQTNTIIFESASFDAISVRKTSTALGLRTEAVQRFEKSIDPNLAELAIKRALEILLKICPEAKIESQIIDIKNFNQEKLTIETSAERITSKIGAPLTAKEIVKIIKSLEFIVKKQGKKLFVEVPTFRAARDVKNEDDIIEEVARIFGYTNIPSVLPELPTRLPIENRERFLKHKIRDIISLGLGFMEVSNYSFYSQDDIKKCALDEKIHIKLLNFLSQDQTHMRLSLLPNMLKSLHETLKNKKNPTLYEIGHTYKEIGEYMPLEEKWLIGIISGEKSFLKAKGYTDSFLEKFGAINSQFVSPRKMLSYAHPKKHTDIMVKGEVIGHVYEIHPEVLKHYDIKQESSAFEINFTRLVALGQRQHKYIQLPKFPSLEFDVSVVLPETITAEEARKSIEKADQNLIKKIDLFDIYRGEGLGEKEKALAYHIELRAEDRTLKDTEMSEVQKKVFANLEGIGGKIRGK